MPDELPSAPPSPESSATESAPGEGGDARSAPPGDSAPASVEGAPGPSSGSGAPVAAPASKPPRASSWTSAPLPAGGANDAEDPLLGTVLLDRVRIVRPIARGGMGKVYFGEQTHMKRPCAIKILDPRLAGGADVQEFARRFLLEASTAAKLTHPNVVTIFDYGETPVGECFIAMEYLEGRSLSEELKDRGQLEADRAVHIAKQVCRALREAHALGVVHRDIKPGNVFLVRRDDDDDFVKVLDFGLVKDTSGPEQEHHTQIGQIMGSPRYMAPEQVQGKAVDGRTDIYSVGAMLFAMLAGRPPFDKATDLATMMAHVSDAPPTVGSVAPDAVLPPGLEAVIMKCLAKSPEDRFASMDELLIALKLNPGAMTTSSDSGGHSAAKLIPPALTVQAAPPPRRSAMPIVLVALAIGLGLSVLLLFRTSSPAPAAPQPSAAAVAPPPPPTPPPPPPAPKPKATLHVETQPAGAKVKEDGETMCEATPCDIVYVGQLADPTYEHLLTFMKADYKLEHKIVRVGASPITVKLARASR